MTIRALCLAVVAALVGAAPAAAEVHVTSSANAGAGSLRDVLAAAPVGETVVIDPGVNPTVVSQVLIDRSVTIRGQGAGATTIGTAAPTRVFSIGSLVPGISVTFEALAIAGGKARKAPSAPALRGTGSRAAVGARSSTRPTSFASSASRWSATGPATAARGRRAGGLGCSRAPAAPAGAAARSSTPAG